MSLSLHHEVVFSVAATQYKPSTNTILCLKVTLANMYTAGNSFTDRGYKKVKHFKKESWSKNVEKSLKGRLLWPRLLSSVE